MTDLVQTPILRFKTDLDDVASKSFFFNLLAQILLYSICLGFMCLGGFLVKWSAVGGVAVMALGPVVGFWLFKDLPESRLGRSLENEALQSKRAQHSPPRSGMPFELFIISRSRLN